jgi:AcrR family transcriptional regulator
MRRTGGRSARVRTSVLDATLELLLAGGSDAVSIPAVARRAGVHETSVYRRWGTANDLILDAVLGRLDVEISPPDTGALRADLVALLRGVADVLQTPLGQVLVQMAMRQNGPAAAALRAAFWNARFAVGAALLARAAARGEVREIEPRPLLEALVGLVFVRVLLTREAVDDGLLEAVVDIAMGGIALAPGG